MAVTWKKLAKEDDVIAKSLLTEKGDIIYASDVGTPAALPHGTDGQVLTTHGHGNTPTWAAGGGGVATDAIWDAKGDLAVGTGANTASKLAVGTDGKYLKADSGEATGMKWDTVTDPNALIWAIVFGG